MIDKEIISVKLKDVRPNPYRNFNLDPLSEDKIVKLTHSIEKDGFMGVLTARRKRNEDGTLTELFEIAFGQHRLEAMKQLKQETISLEVKDCTDAQMLRLMANDNSEDFHHNHALEAILLVKGAVEALAAGKLDEALVSESTRIDKYRFAPHYTEDSQWKFKAQDRSKPYNLQSLANALGLTTKDGKANTAAKAGLMALQLEEMFQVDIYKIVSIRDKEGKLTKNAEISRISSTTQLLKVCSDLMARNLARGEEAGLRAGDAAQVHAENRRVQAEHRAKEKLQSDERQKQVKAIVDACRPELIRKGEETKARIEAKSAAEAKREVLIETQSAELDRRVEKRKKAEAEAKIEDAYLRIRSEVDRICHALEGKYAISDPALFEAIKALVRHDLHAADRERLRQAALKRGTFFTDTVAPQFLPPFTEKKLLTEYGSRLETKRRAALAVGRKRRSL